MPGSAFALGSIWRRKLELSGLQGLFQIRDQVLRMLNADGQANSLRQHPNTISYLRRNPGMRHRRRMAGKRLGAAQANRQFYNLQRI